VDRGCHWATLNGIVLYLDKRSLAVNRSKSVLPSVPSCREFLAALEPFGKVFCLVALAIGLFAAVPRACAQKTPDPSTRPDLPFAISDFDGDLRPDLAVVQAGRSDVSFTDYWIQLQLSAAGSQFLRVVAPTGGLQIAARDVNGDLAPDLVLTTSWRNQPVAIFLNDGHGKFSRIDPSAFPEAFRASTTNWTGVASPPQDLLAVRPQSRAFASLAVALLAQVGSSVRSAQPPDQEVLPSRELASHPGRAPPSKLVQL